MTEAFERDIIDRMARVETSLDKLAERVGKLETVLSNYRNPSPTMSAFGGGVGALIMGGVAVVLKLTGVL